MIHCIISWLYQYLKGAWDGKPGENCTVLDKGEKKYERTKQKDGGKEEIF